VLVDNPDAAGDFEGDSERSPRACAGEKSASDLPEPARVEATRRQRSKKR
jgi:hypothetical protein